MPHPLADRTLPAVLARQASERGSRPFVIDELGVLTYAEAAADAARVGSMFARLGLQVGDRVGIMLPNRREFLLAWFGAVSIGAVEVPINRDNTPERLAYILDHSQCRILVVGSTDLPLLSRLPSPPRSLEHVLVLDISADMPELGLTAELVDWQARLGDTSLAGFDPPAVGVQDAAAIMYTSGSTGPAKGAILSHGHHYMNGYQAVASAGVTERDVIYVATPMYHNMAQGYGIWPALVAGAAIRLAPRFDRERFWSDATACGATIFPFVGAMLVLLAKRPEADGDRDNSLRVGYGVPIPAGLRRPFERRFGLRLIPCYGSTEATIVAWNTDEHDESNAVGRIFPGYQVRIADDDDLTVGPGTAGEICVRADEPYTMFSGYLDDPVRTVAATRNLWFHTGDSGWLDAEGRLWFSDRIGDVIRCKGENISAYEIEQILTEHPDVSLVAAYGVPSELGDEEIVVAVTPQGGRELDLPQVFAWSVGRMPKYMVPRYIAAVAELPLTATGKVEKYKLKSLGVPPNAFDARCVDGATK